MAATIKGIARQTTSNQSVSEGAEVFLRMLRDGSLVGTNWKMAAIFQGLGHMINVGAFSTPILGGGGPSGTIIDADQPEFIVSVPSGTSIMPLRIEIALTTPVIAADADEQEMLVAVDQDATGVTGSSGTAETIYNMNTLVAVPTACTAQSYTSVNMTTSPTMDLELMHRVKYAETATAAGLYWNELFGLYEPDAPPILNGPCNLIGYWGGTVGTSGFAVVQWIEFPTTFAKL